MKKYKYPLKVVTDLQMSDVLFVGQTNTRQGVVNDTDGRSASISLMRGGHWTIRKNGDIWGGDGTSYATIKEDLPSELKSSGVYSGFSKKLFTLTLSINNTILKISSRLKNNIVYKNKLCSYRSHKINVFTLKSDEEFTANFSDLRIFDSEEQATIYLDGVDDAWKRHDKIQAKIKKAKIEVGGYIEIDEKKCNSSAIKNYLETTNRSLYHKVTMIRGDYIITRDNAFHMSYIKSIIEAVYREGKTKEKKDFTIRALGIAMKRKIEAQIEDTSMSIASLQSAIINKLRAKTKMFEKLRNGDISDLAALMEDSISDLTKDKRISKVSFSGENITITTNDLYIRRIFGWSYDEYLPINIGKCIITLDMVNSIVGISRFIKSYTCAGTYEGRHCHVGSGNTLCLGNMDGYVIEAFKKVDVKTIIEVALEILEEINTDGYFSPTRFIDFNQLKPKKKPIKSKKKDPDCSCGEGCGLCGDCGEPECECTC